MIFEELPLTLQAQRLANDRSFGRGLRKTRTTAGGQEVLLEGARVGRYRGISAHQTGQVSRQVVGCAIVYIQTIQEI